MKKKDLAILETYNRYYGRTLYDCYAKPSTAKASSWSDIYREMVAYSGWGLTVLSYNAYMYTCAYKYYNEKLDSEILILHTSSARREIVLE